MDGSNGNGRIETLLERIASNQERMVERQDAMTEALVDVATGLERTRVEVVQLRADTNRGFAQVNARIDNVLAIAGRHHDDHEERIQVLEQRVLGKPG